MKNVGKCWKTKQNDWKMLNFEKIFQKRWNVEKCWFKIKNFDIFFHRQSYLDNF